MCDLVQFESCGSGKVRVQPQHVDCELHLVGDALAGPVAARKEFKVFDQVVLPIAVSVMHGFFRVQLAAKMLLHHVAVFKSVPRWFSVFARHDYSDVPVSLFSCSRLLFWVTCLVAQSTKERSTFGTAKSFLSIDRATRFPLNGHRFSALNARNLPALCGEATPQTAAFCGAIQRVFTKFFAIGVQVRRFVRERFVANFAGETCSFDASRRPPVFCFKASDTLQTAKLSCSIFRFNAERIVAFQALFMDRHGMSSLARIEQGQAILV